MDGIQLADALAGAAVHAFGGGADDHAKRWREILPPISHLSILPDTDEVNLGRPETRRNALLLRALHDRATNEQDLIDGMPELAYVISRRLGLPMSRYSIE